VLNPAKDSALILEGEDRSKGEHTVTIPTSWKGDRTHIYLGFVSEDGKEVSNSICIDDMRLE
jgi:hypothetical protein